jgi:lambda family phage portal protein
MGIRENIGRLLRGAARESQPAPKAAYFKGERNLFMASWRPQLREQQQDVQASWTQAAARAIDAVQNSGFMAGIVEVASGSVVGPGLRMACRPDADALGWTQEKASEWARQVERRFRAWALNPLECDAAGQMTFHQMQQAAFASYMSYGEIVGLMPLIRRPGAETLTKVSMLPPSRIVDYNELFSGWVQGVKVDGWGLPVAYRFREHDKTLGWRERDISARDRDGRPNVLHFKDPAISVTRGISPFAPILKVTRQVDQYFDATLTSALIQTIFAATIKSSINGLAAFDGLMTKEDAGSLDVEAFGAAKGAWYDGAKIDLTQHGRIAHLFPNDELEFKEAKQPGQQFDHFMGWLLREIARGGGVTYESATGDYRGATYSSVRMAGAVEWLTVLRRRENLIIPFCRAVFDAWLEEEVGKGRIEFEGGYEKFLRVRHTAIRSTWTGPARPQADDFKTARAYEVRKDMQATTLAEIAEEYGRDWDDDMRQRKAENDLADELGLPRPWAPKDMIETPEGQDLALQDTGDGAGEKRDPKRPRKSGERDPAERDPAESSLQSELEDDLGDDLDAQLEADLLKSDGEKEGSSGD